MATSLLTNQLPPRYEVKRILAAREGSVTCEVFDSGLRKARAVVKLQALDAPSGEDVANEFQRYIAGLSTIVHPNLGTPYTGGTVTCADGSVVGYSVREYIHGAPLSALSLPIEEPAIARIALQIGHGLQGLDESGFAHHDLKPENIVVQRLRAGVFDRLSQCVLIDLSFRPQAAAGGVLSDVTLQHLAPELLEGASGSMASDLYALGVVLYRLATGQLPFQGQDLGAIIRAQKGREFRRLSECGMSAEFERLVERLLEPHPRNRLSTIDDLVAVVAAWTASDATHSVRIGARQSWGFVGRDQQIDDCVSSLNVASKSRSVGCLAVTGAPGMGVSAFLRQLQDKLESRGAEVLTAQPRAVCGTPIPEQLAAHVHAIVRRHGAADRSSANSTPTTTELLDDLFIAACDRRVVLFVDDSQRCDTAELSFLARYVLQDAALRDDARGRCQLVLGTTGDESRELSQLISARIQLGPLHRDELAALVTVALGATALGRVELSRIEEATSGTPKRVTRVLRAVGKALEAGSGAPEAVSVGLQCVVPAARGSPSPGIQELLSHSLGRCEVAVALFGDTLPIGAWDKLVRASGSDNGEPRFVKVTRNGDDTGVRSSIADTSERIWRTLPERELASLCGAMLSATRELWRSDDPAMLSALLRFVARMRRIPSSYRWRVLRTLMILLRYGALSSIESFAASVSADEGSWYWLFAQASRMESGRGTRSEPQKKGHNARYLFYQEWIVARGLRRARHRREAFERMKEIKAKHPQLAISATGFLEDLGVTAAEVGQWEEATAVRRQLLSQVGRWLVALRRRGGGTGSFLWLKNARKISSYYRLRFRLHASRHRYRRAVFASRRERALNRLTGNIFRESACLNNEGVALLRNASPLSVGLFERCARLREVLDDERGLVVALNNLANALSSAGRVDECAGVLNRARIVAARNGLWRHHSISLLNLGQAYATKGQLADARKVLRRVMRYASDVGDVDVLAWATFNMAKVAVDRWRIVQARGYIARLHDLFRQHVDAPADANPNVIEAELSLRLGDLERLRQCARDCAATGAKEAFLLSFPLGERPRVPSDASVALRLRALTWKVRTSERRVSAATASRMTRLAKGESLHRICLEWIELYLARGARDVAAFDWCVKELAALGSAEGHDDLHIRIGARLHNLAKSCGRDNEAWRLLTGSLMRFRSLERRLARTPDTEAVLSQVHEVLSAAVWGNGATHARARATRAESLLAGAFAKMVGGGSTGSVGGPTASMLELLGAEMGAARDFQGLLERTMTIALEASGAQRAMIISVAGNTRHVKAFRSRLPNEASDPQEHISWAVVSSVLATGKASVHDDALSDEELASHRSVAVLRLRSLACFPIRTGGEPSGVLYLDHHGIAGLFGGADLGFFGLLAGVVGLVLRLSESQEALRAASAQRESAYQHLVRAERSRVAGELAAGIVHDLKNVLAAVIARSQMVQAHELSDAAERSIRAIEAAADTGVEMLSRLQECSRDHTLQDETEVDLCAVVREALELVRPRLAASEVVPHFEETTRALVSGIAGELRETFVNLFVNACDAMPTGGDLFVAIDTKKSAELIEVTVADTGQGVPKDVLPRLFEPFYTTKGHRGTGLGLAVVRSTIVKYGGTIRVESEPGKGTVFSVALPKQ